MEQIFYYKIEDLHNLANRESVYALDSLDSDNGPELTDRHILGMDEDLFFKRMIKTAGGVVFKRIHRRGRGVTNPYQFDVEYEGTPGYIVITLDFPENFDSALYDAIDSQLQECLVYHVLAGWFSKQRRNFLASDYKKFYEDGEDQLKSLIEMRTLVRRPTVFWDRYFKEEETE